MNDAMSAEFDTVASWTADVALDLGPEFHEPAGCRGSGSPASLDWLGDRLGLAAGRTLLDCGAGVGGPAAYASRRTGTRPVLTDPEPGACVAACRLFDLPVVQAATPLPFPTATFDTAWSLGVLCTIPAAGQLGFLAEIRRVLRRGSKLGLLVFVKGDGPLSESPDGNTFPTDQRLGQLLDRAGFSVEEVRGDDFGPPPEDWTRRTDVVDEEMSRRHGADPVWCAASEQAAVVGRLLSRGEVSGRLLVATA